MKKHLTNFCHKVTNHVKASQGPPELFIKKKRSAGTKLIWMGALGDEIMAT